MLSILYWISATLPSNIFVLLMVDDLCRHTLTADKSAFPAARICIRRLPF